MNEIFTSVICANATHPGAAALAVVRMSGAGSFDIAERMLFVKNGDIKDIPPRRAVYCCVRDGEETVDDVVAVFYKGPSSYTGEDSVEITCHGGSLIVRRILSLMCRYGAVPAQPGEFSRRAFANGKLTLTEAESIIDSIEAKTPLQLKIANAHRSGDIDRRAQEIAGELKALLGGIYAAIDFPEEEIGALDRGGIADGVNGILKKVSAFAGTYEAGKIIRDGVPTAIVGRPNTGKSSFLNMLLGRDRAIVAGTAGTTRDTLEETCVCGGVMLNLADTAGIHESCDGVELEGIRRAKEKADDAALIFAVFDGSMPLTDDDLSLIERLLRYRDKQIVAVINKRDLGVTADESKIPPVWEKAVISTRYSEDTDRIDGIVKKLFGDDLLFDSGEAMITSARQHAAVRKAEDALKKAADMLTSGMPADMAAAEIEAAYAAIAELDGRQISEEIANEIFSRFCVGK